VTTPMLIKTVQSGKIDPKKLITHRFNFDQILDAYDIFGRAVSTKALKVIIEAAAAKGLAQTILEPGAIGSARATAPGDWRYDLVTAPELCFLCDRRIPTTRRFCKSSSPM
jgi:hypothetical protein